MMTYLLSMSGLFFLSYLTEYSLLVASFFFFFSSMFIPMINMPVVAMDLFFLDSMGSCLIVLSFWVSGLMIIASDSVNRFMSSFVGWILTLCVFLVLVFSVSSLFSFYLFFEASLIPVTVMVLGWGYQPERLQAGFYMVVYMVGASLPLLLSMYLMYSENGHFSFFLSMWGVPMCFSSLVWWVMSILAFMAKTPIYSLHLWLPKAHVEAPVAGSMILAGVLLKLGVYGVFRLMGIFQVVGISLSGFISSISLWGGVLCGMVCLRQTDVKSLIAYSSVTHMGVMLGGVMSSCVLGWQGGLLMALSHGLVSSSMFMGANVLYQMFSSRSLFFIKGVVSVVPSFSVFWFMSMSANMGVPPTLNIVSEVMLVAGIIFSSLWFLIPAALCLFFSAVYSLTLFSISQYGGVGEMSFFFSFPVERMWLSSFLHLVPVFFFFFKVDMVSCWIV